MKKISHTPGPWKVEDGEELLIVTEHNSVRVAGVIQENADDPRVPLADARLIVEAPAMRELLAVVDRLFSRIRREGFSAAFEPADIEVEIRALLARIDGEEVPTPPATCPECGDTLTPPREVAEAGALPPNYCRTCDRQVRDGDEA